MALVEFRIVVNYDAEASVWWVSECSVPGVHLEDSDPWGLIGQAVECAPDLLALNATPAHPIADEEE